MDKITEEIQKLQGNIELSIIALQDKNRVLYLIIQNQNKPVFIFSLVLQITTTTKNTIYNQSRGTFFIESLDSTGCFEPRSLQSYYIKNIIKIILDYHSPKYLEIFSHPKKEIVFNLSHKHVLKGQMMPEKLVLWWESVLKELRSRNLFIYSQYKALKSYPYEKLTNYRDILIFNDDPKNKLLKLIDREASVQDFFDMLLFRKDMARGGFLFSIGNSNEYKEPSWEFAQIEDILNYLRGLDFSSYESSCQSTKEVVNKYKFQLKWFKTNKGNFNHSPILKDIPVIEIKPRKNHKKNQ